MNENAAATAGLTSAGPGLLPLPPHLLFPLDQKELEGVKSSSPVPPLPSMITSPTAPTSKTPTPARPPLKPSEMVPDQILKLPGGWTKRVTQRQNGVSMGKFDIYLTPPGVADKNKLRSVPDLFRYLIQHKTIIDPKVVNFDKSKLK